MTEAAPPIDATTPAPPASGSGWTYPQLAQSWWIAFFAVFAAPHWIIAPALSPTPPPVSAVQTSLGWGMALGAGFLLVSLILYTRWRDRLPEVVRARWYGPAQPEGRRRGFWILWTLAAIHAWLFLGAIGPRAASTALINGAAAYLRPDLSEFGVEAIPSEKSGLLHLRLLNVSRADIGLVEGQEIGEVHLDCPDGPYLLGKPSIVLPVILTTEVTGLTPLPTAVPAGDALEFLLPIPGWQVMREESPKAIRLDLLYFPYGTTYQYAPIDLYHGHLQDVPSPP